jgi:hypothetical protein
MNRNVVQQIYRSIDFRIKRADAELNESCVRNEYHRAAQLWDISCGLEIAKNIIREVTDVKQNKPLSKL